MSVITPFGVDKIAIPRPLLIFGKLSALEKILLPGFETLSKLPRNSAKNRVMNRCQITGRPHGVYRKLKISRIALRQLGLQGKIPGLVKSSW